MPFFFLPLIIGGIGGAWWTKETVEAVTGGENGRPPYFLIVLVIVGLFIAHRKGWLK